jgi:hypothetical protein
MHISINVNRQTNFFYWVQALSGWSVYDGEKKTYDYYAECVNSLSIDQNNALQQIKDVLINSEHPRHILSELYNGRPQHTTAQKVFGLAQPLEEVFNEIWFAEEPILKEWEDTLSSIDWSELNGVMTDITTFLDSRANLETPVNIRLLLTSPLGSAIGHTIRDANFILLHPAGSQTKNSQSTTRSTLLHELTHYIEFNSKITSKLFKESYERYIQPHESQPPVGFTWKMMYEEVIAQCFANNITGGLLRPYTYNLPVQTVDDMKSDFEELYSNGNYTTNQLISWIALNVSLDYQQYVKTKKTIDTDFVDGISKLFINLILTKSK